MTVSEPCWWCQRPVFGGVCMGPHPDFTRSDFRWWHNVEDVALRPAQGRVQGGAKARYLREWRARERERVAARKGHAA